MKFRLVSLVPSLTETIALGGFREALVGITSFCVEPRGLHRIAAPVGGTKDPDLEKIRHLRPTHIFVNLEENKPEHIDECRTIAPTLATFPKGPRDVPAMLEAMDDFLGVTNFESLRWKVSSQLVALDGLAPATSSSYLYYIWKNPYMVIGRDTYISRMLELAGMKNCLEGDERYPVLPVGQAAALSPDQILLSSEPYPFRKRDAAALMREWPSCSKILRVDGKLMSWYGTTTVQALDEIIQMRRGLDRGRLMMPF
jgi:ABC-type Fe3+-hydroxamate transport system substrate-binding protein